MTAPGWPPLASGVVALPSGARVRGRGRREPAAPADHAIVLTTRPVADRARVVSLVRWPDFGTPADDEEALDAIADARDRAGRMRVEVVCAGGTGRTGTALAAMAMLDGLDADAALAWVRSVYRPRAVETASQRRWLRDVVDARRR